MEEEEDEEEEEGSAVCFPRVELPFFPAHDWKPGPGDVF